MLTTKSMSQTLSVLCKMIRVYGAGCQPGMVLVALWKPLQYLMMCRDYAVVYYVARASRNESRKLLKTSGPLNITEDVCIYTHLRTVSRGGNLFTVCLEGNTSKRT